MKRSVPACLLACISICIPFISGAQLLRNSISMPYLSLGAYSTKQADPFSFTGNQAALMQARSPGIGVYGERRFMLPGNDVYCMAAAVPTAKGNFGLQVNYSGFPGFSEQAAGLAYARSLGSRADLGVQFNYYSYRIPGYGNASAIYFEAGAIVHLTEKLNAGIHFYNPYGGKLEKKTGEKIASVYQFGIGYDASEEFYFGGTISREENEPINVIAGIQYRFKKQFFFRGGFRSDNSTGFGGAGFMYKGMRMDIIASYHQQLGISPGVLLAWNLKKIER